MTLAARGVSQKSIYSPRTLVFGCSWAPDEEKRALCQLWAKAIEKYAPGVDVLVIDCGSPFNPKLFLKPFGYESARMPRDEEMKYLVALGFTKTITSFDDNVGHLSLGGKDGWGRSFSKGLQIAMACKYDYVVYIECDTLISFPIMPIVEKMERCGVKAAGPMEMYYHFWANEISFFNVDYLRNIDFVGKYNWANPPPPPFEIVPERRCEVIVQDEFFVLPLRGCRNTGNQVTVENMKTAFPLGLDWIAHAKDFQLYEAYAAWKGFLK